MAQLEASTTFSVGYKLMDKNITQNGTYDPADDNVDGYSQVIVNVAGGAGSYLGLATDALLADLGGFTGIYVSPVMISEEIIVESTSTTS